MKTLRLLVSAIVLILALSCVAGARVVRMWSDKAIGFPCGDPSSKGFSPQGTPGIGELFIAAVVTTLVKSAFMLPP
jgi:hypothetical protein